MESELLAAAHFGFPCTEVPKSCGMILIRIGDTHFDLLAAKKSMNAKDCLMQALQYHAPIVHAAHKSLKDLYVLLL